MKKVCRSCLVEKESTEFYWNSRGTARRTACKECCADSSRRQALAKAQRAAEERKSQGEPLALLFCARIAKVCLRNAVR